MTLSPPAARPAPTAAPSMRTHSGASTRLNASAGKRAGAYLIDVAIIAAAGALVWFFSGSLLLVAVLVIELWAAGWIWEGHTGATPGNLICGIRTVQRDKLLSVGALRLLPRSLLIGVAHIIPILLPVGLAASGALDGLARARMIDVRKVRAAGAGLSGAPSLEAHVSGMPPEAGSGQRLITSAPGGPSRAVGAVPKPVTPEPTAAPAPVEAPYMPSGVATVPVLELSDGTVIQATGLGFIGRAPRAPESIPEAILVRVPDGARSLSRTHASFGVEDGDLWVQDLGSANGASVRHLGGSVTELTPHTPFFLVPGDVLVLGGDAELAFRRVVDRSQPAAAPQPAQSPSQPPQDPPAQAVPVMPAAPVAPVPDRIVAEPDFVAETAVVPEYAPPAAAAVAAPPTPAPNAAIALRFQNGTTVPINGTGYIGRAPSLPEDERTDAALIAVPDGDRSVSRTHGRFGVLQNQTWFEDLGSGNGSALRTSDGRSGPMTPHQRFTLVSGMTLQLGDCIIDVVAA